MGYMKKFELKTEDNGVHVITDEIRKIISESHIESGFCIIHCPHTTASLVITSYIDENGRLDLAEEFNRLVPCRYDFHHQNDTPTDAAGHVKTALVGTTLTAIVEQGTLLLGSSQGIMFLEYDGPRNRQVYVKVIAG